MWIILGSGSQFCLLGLLLYFSFSIATPKSAQPTPLFEKKRSSVSQMVSKARSVLVNLVISIHTLQYKARVSFQNVIVHSPFIGIGSNPLGKAVALRSFICILCLENLRTQQVVNIARILNSVCLAGVSVWQQRPPHVLGSSEAATLELPALTRPSHSM